MAYSVLPSKSTLDEITAAEWNTYIRDNFDASPAAKATAKGDLFPASALRAITRLAAGSDGQICESDSGQTTGIKNSWAFVPVGGIIMWGGALGSLPSNWQLCNGTNGTPDLRNDFVIGAGGSYAVGDAGGGATANLAHTHSTTDGNSGNHSHTSGTTGAGGAHTHIGETGTPSATDAAVVSTTYNIATSAHTHSITSQSESAHTHTAPAAGSTQHSHTLTTNSQLSSTQAILPPYYALAFIMRLS